MAEWINPRYAGVVANLKARQDAQPDEVCPGCDGRGKKFVPDGLDSSPVKCRACGGAGRRPAGARSFLIT
jgi:DnaJ-class molecular chaperone